VRRWSGGWGRLGAWEKGRGWGRGSGCGREKGRRRELSPKLFISLCSLGLNLEGVSCVSSGISCFILIGGETSSGSDSSDFSLIRLAMVNAFFFGLSDSEKKS